MNRVSATALAISALTLLSALVALGGAQAQLGLVDETPLARTLPPGSTELTSARTEFSKTWVLPNGSYVAEMAWSPLHYRDAAGAWQDIDTTLLPVPGGFQNVRNTVKTGVGHDGSLVMSLGETHLRYVPSGLVARDAAGQVLGSLAPAPKEAKLADGALAFPEAYPGAAFQVHVERALVAHDVELLRLPSIPGASAPATLGVEGVLTLPAGTLVRANGSEQTGDFVTPGGVAFVLPNGERFGIQAVVAHDAGYPALGSFGGKDPHAIRGQLRVERVAEGVRVSAEFPYAWVSSPARLFPVLLDPYWDFNTFEASVSVRLHQSAGGVGLYDPYNFLESGNDEEESTSCCWYQADSAYRWIARQDLTSIDNNVFAVWSVSMKTYNHGSDTASGTPGPHHFYAATDDAWLQTTANWDNTVKNWAIGASVGSIAHTGVGWTQTDFSSAANDPVGNNILGNHVNMFKGNDQFSFQVKDAQETCVSGCNVDRWDAWTRSGTNAPLMRIGYTADYLAPTTTATKSSGADATTGWYRGAKPFMTFSCSDGSGSGCQRWAEYRVNGGSWLSYDLLAYPLSPIYAATEGTTTIDFRSKDMLNNLEAYKTDYLRWDTQAPSTTFSNSRAADGNGGWYKGGSVTVTVKRSDATPGSGVLGTWWKLNNGAETYQAGNADFTVPISGDREHTLVTRTKDNAGHEETKTHVVKIDGTAPTAGAGRTCTTSATNTFAGDAPGWCYGQVNYLSSGSDNLGTIYVSCTSPGGTTCSSSVSAQGTYSFSVTVSDPAGNSATASTSWGIDTADPYTGRSEGVTDVKGQGVWWKSPVNVQLHPQDNGTNPSGFKTTYYNKGSGAVVGTSTQLNQQGQNTLTYWTIDKAARTETTRTADYWIDTTIPSTTVGKAGPQVNPPWYTGDVTISLSNSETVSTPVTQAYYLTPPGGAEGGQTPYNAAFLIQNEGTSYVRPWSKDQAGNEESAPKTSVQIDKSLPWTYVTLSGTLDPTGQWYTTGVRVTLEARDNVSGPGGSAYRILSNGVWGAWTNYYSPFEITAQGAHTIEFHSGDVAGNVGVIKSTGFKIDSVAPVSSPPTLSCTATWCKSAVTVALNAGDGAGTVSGVASKHYKVNADPEGTYSAPFPVGGEGVNTLAYWAKDGAGNVEAYKYATIRVDTKPPVTAAGIGASGPGGWFTVPVKVYLNSTDPAPASNVSVTRYQIDNGTVTDYTGPFDVGTNGHHEVQYWSVDNAGNAETLRRLPFKIDRTAPSVYTGSSPAPNGNNSWHRIDPAAGVNAVVFNASCVDNNPPCASLVWWIDNDAPQNYNDASRPQLAAEGWHNFTVKGTDAAGLSTTSAPRTVKIDSVKPSAYLNASCAMGGAGWCKGTATLAAAIADATSGPGPIAVGPTATGPWTTYSAASPPTFAENGYYTRHMKGEDAAGNANATAVVFKVDVTGPNATVQYVSGTAGTNGWHKSNVVVRLNATDSNRPAESNASAVKYRVNGGAIQTATLGQTITLSASGANTVEAWGVDNAGNEGAHVNASWSIDKDIPTSSISYSPAQPVSTWWKDCVTPVITAADATSPPAFITWRLDGGAWNTTAPIQICWSGVHVLEFYATDQAGNSEAVKSVTIRVDRQVPTCRTEVESGAPGSNGWYVSGVNFKLFAADNHSGVQTVRYQEWNNGAIYLSWQNGAPDGVYNMTVEGTNKLQCDVTDVAGNGAVGPETTFKTDLTNPSHQATVTAPVTGGDWIKGCANVTYTRSDATSGVDLSYWRLGATAWSSSAPGPFCGAGVHTFESYTKDKSGRSSAVDWDLFKVDNTPPTCTVQVYGGRVVRAPWYVEYPTFAINASDFQPGSNVTWVKSRLWNGTTLARDWTPVAGPETLTVEGKDTVDCQARDNALWDSPVVSATAWVDTVEPLTTASVTGRKGSNDWFTECPTVTLSTYELTSGREKTLYRVDGGAWLTYTAPFTVCGDKDSHLVEFRSYDNAGNEEDLRSVSFKVDTNAPGTTAAQPQGLKGDHGWFIGPVSIALACADGTGSGCDRMYHAWNSDGLTESDPGTSQKTVTRESDGTHYLRYFSKDRAGLTEAEKQTPSLGIDRTLPTVGQKVTGRVGGEGWIVQLPRIYINASDATSGVWDITYTLTRVNGPAPVQTIVESDRVVIDIEVDGTYQLTYRARDNAGHATADATVQFRVDTTGPATSANVAGPTEGDWFKLPTTVGFTCGDGAEGSGCKWPVNFRVNNGTWMTAQPTETHSFGNGRNWLEWYAQDLALNNESVKNRTVYVDSQKPETQPPIFSSQTFVKDGVRYVSPRTQIQLRATDPLSGVKEINYWIDGVKQSPLANNGAFTLGTQGDGVHVIRVSARDVALNDEDEWSFSVTVDGTAPEVAIVDPRKDSITLEDVILSLSPPYVQAQGHASTGVSTPEDVHANAAAIVVRRMTINVQASDSPAGMSRVEFYIDGDKNNLNPDDAICIVRDVGPWVCPWDVTSYGLKNHVVYVRAVDKFENARVVERQVTTVPVPAPPQGTETVTPTMNSNMRQLIDGMNVCIPSGWTSAQVSLMYTCISNTIETINAATPDGQTTTSASTGPGATTTGTTTETTTRRDEESA